MGSFFSIFFFIVRVGSSHRWGQGQIVEIQGVLDKTWFEGHKNGFHETSLLCWSGLVPCTIETKCDTYCLCLVFE
jgi:hypothetical protein